MPISLTYGGRAFYKYYTRKNDEAVIKDWLDSMDRYLTRNPFQGCFHAWYSKGELGGQFYMSTNAFKGWYVDAINEFNNTFKNIQLEILYVKEWFDFPAGRDSFGDNYRKTVSNVAQIPNGVEVTKLYTPLIKINLAPEYSKSSVVRDKVILLVACFVRIMSIGESYYDMKREEPKQNFIATMLERASGLRCSGGQSFCEVGTITPEIFKMLDNPELMYKLLNRTSARWQTAIWQSIIPTKEGEYVLMVKNGEEFQFPSGLGRRTFNNEEHLISFLKSHGYNGEYYLFTITENGFEEHSKVTVEKPPIRKYNPYSSSNSRQYYICHRTKGAVSRLYTNYNSAVGAYRAYCKQYNNWELSIRHIS